ncbi:hypothetical protein EJK15_67620 [Nonomuraea basaltis]|nr:hypothetical protein EJK15_67620 [Nonomuraea basaltis]
MTIPPDLSSQFPDWSLWRSDQGRWWATRSRPFSVTAGNAEAHRTVDADDVNTLAERIAEQGERRR